MPASPCSALFIGGPKDGERMMIPDERPYIRVFVTTGGIDVFEYWRAKVSNVRNFSGLSLYADPSADTHINHQTT